MSAETEKAPTELVLVGGATDEELVREISRLISFLEQAPSALLEDVAYTTACAARGKRCVLSVVVNNVRDLISRLESAKARIVAGVARIRDKNGTYYFREHVAGPGTNGKVAFLFPGATSFYADMLRDLVIMFPVCRAPFDELEEAMAGLPLAAGFSPSVFVYPPASCYRHDAESFASGGYAQCIVSTFAANLALYNLFRALGVAPDAVFGFSGGDISALAVAGALGEFKRPARVKFLREYYSLVDRAVDRSGLPKCRMVSVISPRPGALASALAEYTAKQVIVAFNQTARQHTIAMLPEIAESAEEGFAQAGLRVLKMAIDRPFNTPWCEKLVPEFRKFAKSWVDFKLHLPLYSCSKAKPLDPSKVRGIRDAVAEEWASTICFEETVLRMAGDGYRVFLEMGPRETMCSAIDDILRGRGCAALPANRKVDAGLGLNQLHLTLGHLAALGVKVDAAFLHATRRQHLLDLDSPLTLEIKADSEMRLSRVLPQLVLFSNDTTLAPAEAKGPGKAAERAAAVERGDRRKRQYDFGSISPLISSRQELQEEQGKRVELLVTLDAATMPFLRDYAYGTTQLSYSEKEMRGYLPLPLSVGAEMMAELSQDLVPGRRVVRIENLISRRQIAFSGGKLVVVMQAVRTELDDAETKPEVAEAANYARVKVRLWANVPNATNTDPVMEGEFYLSKAPPEAAAWVANDLPRPRNVHWTAQEIYPARLHYGERLQLVEQADTWSELGLNYTVVVPPNGNVMVHTRFPIWVVDPMMLEGIFSGFPLWRTHERFGENFCAVIRLRKLELHAASFTEGQQLNCYLRLSSFTPQTLSCDISVTDGNGNLLIELDELEQSTQRVPPLYRQMILSPSSTYLTDELPAEIFGATTMPISGTVVSDVPYHLFEGGQEFWLKVMSNLVLGRFERKGFEKMTGSTRRRTEWLFGRISAKEAVRRFMMKHYQGHWADADVRIWVDDSGKPHALGEWSDNISAPFDITIAHTEHLVVAAVAPGARIGLDVEACSRMLPEEFVNGVFDDKEREILDGASAGQNATLRFWCAKEAVSKLLGTGIRYSPKDLRVIAFNPDVGALAVELCGQWLEAFKQFRGRTIPVKTSILRGHVLAACALPGSLFGDAELEDENEDAAVVGLALKEND